MNGTKATIFTAILGFGLIAGYFLLGFFDVSASSPHSGFASWAMSTTSHASIERRAKEIEVPDLQAESLALAGINDFDAMCAGCHGAPGKAPEAMGQGLNPPAPDLAEEAGELSPAELFWVTKNGIRMTGMPAWGVTHDDDSIWPVVAFMTRLPGLDASSYQAMLTSAAGHGHHADDDGAAPHSHGTDEAAADENVHVHADGTEHVHEEAADESATPTANEHEHDEN